MVGLIGTTRRVSWPDVNRHDTINDVLRLKRQWVMLGALAFAVAMVLVRLFARSDFWLTVLPGYLTGAGTLGLGVVAYLTMLQEATDRRALQAEARMERARADQAEQRERDAQLIRLRREQAERVQVRPIAAGGGVNLEFRYDVTIVNLSVDAITEVDVFVALVPPEASDPDGQLPLQRLPRVVGQDQSTVQVRITLRQGYTNSTFTAQAWVVFRDSQGQLWVRDPKHELVEVDAQYLEAMYVAVRRGMVDPPR